MEERNTNSSEGPKQGGPNPDRFQSKPLIIWLIFIALILMLLALPQEETSDRQLTVAQVLALAEEGQVKTATLKEDVDYGAEGYEITGKMQNVQLVDPAAEGEEATGEAAASEADGEALETAEAGAEAGEASEDGLVSYVARGRLTEDSFERLRAAIPPDNFKEEPSGRLWRSLIANLLPILLIFGLIYFLFIRQLRMAGKGAMSFGKSKAKMLTRDKERATFNDVAGCDEAKEEVAEIVEFLRSPKKFQNIGGRIPKGILMVGPPGTGKTPLAKAIAGEADVPFFSISGSDFVEMFVGVGAARVRDMFDQGRRHAPCIIFIDEIDAVGRQRGSGMGGGNDEREQTLNSLLVEMDGFDTQEGIIIIAATNRADVLDQALMRPGRFDRQIAIDLPDLAGREAILKVHSKKVKMARDVDLQRVARATPGFSGADLANLLNEAALLAARYDKKEVTMADIEEARDKIAFGRERRKLMDDEDRQSTAWHEAGHALVQALINDRKLQLHKVTIIPRGRALGLTMASPTKDILGMSQREYENMICNTMAGRIAEKTHTGDISSGASNDILQATRMARHMVCDLGMSRLGPVAYGENRDQIFLAREITRRQEYSEETARQIDEEIRRIVQEQYDRAESMIREHEDGLRKIAEALLEYETIDGEHVREILEFGEIRTPVLNNLKTREGSKGQVQPDEAEKKEPSREDDGEFGAEPAGAPA
ncbi:MAG: ATP-dependent zinc metalloprotease FtsH [Opitutales bacterium]